MKLSRRDWLGAAGTLGLGVVAPGVAGCSSGDGDGDAAPETDDLPVYVWEGEPGPEGLFAQGVASGDPLPDAVVLWTRVSAPDGRPVEVWWEISENDRFTRRVKVGTVTTQEDRDFTVKVDATGLSPGRTYFYRFFAMGRESPTGRTRTAPAGPVDRLRFAVVSCSNHAYGYFHVYGHVAARSDLDAVLHLGDYIYEYGTNEYGRVRVPDPETEILTLDDYRRRYRQYREDPQLQAAHRMHPFITVWDDHESSNDSWNGGAENHDPATEGLWSERKRIAAQVYFEWMPIRDTAERKIFRKLSYGDLCDLIMLDTRLYGRDEQLTGPFGTPVSDTLAEQRELLGAEQEQWLAEQLRTSTARWKFLGQQVMMGQLKIEGLPLSQGGGKVLNLDQWDGYPHARERVLRLIRDTPVRNVVVLTGDIHSSWAIELALDPNDPAVYDPATGRGAIAVEFVTPAVSSPGSPVPGLFETLTDARNPHIKYVNGSLRGSLILDVTPERVQGAFFHVERVDEDIEMPEFFSAAWSVHDGTAHLVQDAEPAPPRV